MTRKICKFDRLWLLVLLNEKPKEGIKGWMYKQVACLKQPCGEMKDSVERNDGGQNVLNFFIAMPIVQENGHFLSSL